MRHKRFWVVVACVFLTPFMLAAGCGLALLAGAGGGISSATECMSNAAVSLAPAPAQINTAGVTIAGQPVAPDQISNARTIVGIASSRGLSYRDALVALMVAMQESRLRSLPYGDRDSLGLFQQRPSQGWGTAAEIMNPIYATNKFFEALVAVPNRNSLSLIDEAMKVQRPNAADYERTFSSWQPAATAILGTSYQPLDAGTSAQQVAYDTACPAGSATVEAFIQAAQSQIGKKYVWGGQSPSVGFDCSGLVLWALSQIGIKYPDMTAAGEYNLGPHVTRSQLERGDLVFWASNPSDPSTIDHVAIYLGANQIIVAPHTGALVEISPMYWTGFAGGTRLNALASASSSSGPTIHWQAPIVSRNYATSGPDNGIEYSAPAGALVYVASDGTVTSVGSDPDNGLSVVVNHQGGVQTQYAHLGKVASGIVAGSKIKAGTVIGYVGSSGSGVGSRLLFFVKVNGQPVDPVQFLQQYGVRLS